MPFDEQGAQPRQVALLQSVRRGSGAGCLGHHVAHAAEQRALEQRLERRQIGGDELRQRPKSRPRLLAQGQRQLAFAPPLVQLAWLSTWFTLFWAVVSSWSMLSFGSVRTADIAASSTA